jgi:hypothetical protein
MVILDSHGAMLRSHKILDLVKEPLTEEKKPYRICRALTQDNLPIDVRNSSF